MNLKEIFERKIKFQGSLGLKHNQKNTIELSKDVQEAVNEFEQWIKEDFEPMEYSKSDFWIIYYKGKLVEDLTPKMLIELYNKIKDIENG